MDDTLDPRIEEATRRAVRRSVRVIGWIDDEPVLYREPSDEEE